MRQISGAFITLLIDVIVKFHLYPRGGCFRDPTIISGQSGHARHGKQKPQAMERKEPGVFMDFSGSGREGWVGGW